MVEVKFKVISSIDRTLQEQGILETDEADSEFPIQWLHYGLVRFFPNNPFDPDWQIADYNRHNSLRNNVLNDKELVQLLCDFAEEDVTIKRNGYDLVINGGSNA